MSKYCRWPLLLVLMLVLLGSGCGSKPLAVKNKGASEPVSGGESISATAFSAFDFITAAELKFDPEDLERPAVINFFTPG